MHKIHGIQWATFMNELRSKSERNKVKYWVNERICTHEVELDLWLLSLSVRRTRISCRRQQCKASEIRKKTWSGVTFSSSSLKVLSKMLHENQKTDLISRSREGNERICHSHLSSSYSNLGIKGISLLHENDLKLELKSPTQTQLDDNDDDVLLSKISSRFVA